MIAAIINVITSPKDGFDYILKSLNWRHAFIPILILSLLNIFSGLVMEEEVKSMNFERASEWINNSERMTDEQKDQAIQGMEDRINANSGLMGRVFSQDVIDAYPELDKYSLILIAAKMVRKGLAPTEVEALRILEKGELDVEPLIQSILNPHLDEISNTEEDDDDDAGVAQR